MSKAFGNILMNLRQERGLKQEELSEGLCAGATLSRIESGERDPDYLLFDAFMTRLGKDSLKWEVILKQKDKELLQKRNRMEHLLRLKELDVLEREIQEYGDYSEFTVQLHEQYLLYMEGCIAVERNQYKLAVDKYQEALDKTENKVDFHKTKIEGIYSRIELRLLCLLGRAIVSVDDFTYQIKLKYLRQLKNYIEDHCTDEWYRLQNYMLVLYSTALLYCEEKYVTESFILCKRAILELIEKRSSFSLKELLILVERLREQGLDNSHLSSLPMDNIPYFIEILEEWSIENQNVDIRDIENYSYQNMTTISEIIKNTRTCLGKTQEDIMLSEDGSNIVVDQSGLSKIENGKREPGKKLIQHCFGQLDLAGKDRRYSLPLEDENFEVQELRWDIDYYISIHKKEMVHPLLERLTQLINTENVYNKQYLKRVEFLLKKEKEQIPTDICIDTLLDILKLTVPNIEKILYNGNKWGFYFSQEELILLLNIGVAFHCEGNYTEALEYYKKIEQYHQLYILSDRKLYRTLLQNLSSVYGLVGEYDYSIEKSNKCLLFEILAADMNKKHRALFNIAWCFGKKMELEYKDEYKLKCKRYFKQAWYLSKIMKDIEITKLVEQCCKEWELFTVLQD